MVNSQFVGFFAYFSHLTIACPFFLLTSIYSCSPNLIAHLLQLYISLRWQGRRCADLSGLSQVWRHVVAYLPFAILPVKTSQTCPVLSMWVFADGVLEQDLEFVQATEYPKFECTFQCGWWLGTHVHYCLPVRCPVSNTETVAGDMHSSQTAKLITDWYISQVALHYPYPTLHPTFTLHSLWQTRVST